MADGLVPICPLRGFIMVRLSQSYIYAGTPFRAHVIVGNGKMRAKPEGVPPHQRRDRSCHRRAECQRDADEPSDRFGITGP